MSMNSFHGKLKETLRFTLLDREVDELIKSFVDSIDEELQDCGRVVFKNAFVMKRMESVVKRRNVTSGEKLPPANKKYVKCTMSKKFGGYNITEV